MRKLTGGVLQLALLAAMAGCSQPTATVGGVISVDFDSAALAGAGRDELASACHLTRMTRDDHYGLNAEQMYVEPHGTAARDAAMACAKAFPHVDGVGLPL
jgi:hypothetical protein